MNKKLLLFVTMLPYVCFGSTVHFNEIFDFDSLASREVDRLRSYYDELARLPSGRKIINKIKSFIDRGDSTKICLKSGDSASYVCSSNSLEFNIDKMENSTVGCVVRKRTDDGRYEIGKSINPPHIVLGHELIHAIDYNTNKARYTRTRGYTGRLWRNLHRKRVIPADEYSPRPTEINIDRFLWTSDLEQRAVIGEESSSWDSSFTEFMLRIDSGLPPRYAYQPADSNFYEDAEIIERIMQRHLGVDWGEKFEATNPERNSEFDPEVAETSRYSYKTPPSTP